MNLLTQNIKLASRNLWRNKRRTLITAASIAFAVFFAIVMLSFSDGVWSNMVRSTIELQTGYLQIQNREYMEDKSLNNSFEESIVPDSIPGIIERRKRIQTFSLASQGELTHGALIQGVEIEKEKEFFSDKIIDGKVPEPDSDEALIGEGLADYLDISTGDTVILIGQGFRGTNAVAALPVSGIIEFPSPEINSQIVYMPVNRAQYIFRMEGRITAMILDPENKKSLLHQKSLIEQKIDTSQYSVRTWEELLSELVEARTADEAGTYIILVILYIIIAFGIFGVILMSVKERSYEFGVLVAIGMKPRQLGFVVWVENIFTGVIGVLLGGLIALPVVLYFHYNPIPLTGEMGETYENFGIEPVIFTAVDLGMFITQIIVVFLMVTVLALYPILNVLRLDPVNAMRE